VPRKAKEENREFKAYISERYPFLSVGGMLRFGGGYYKARSEQEEEWIEDLREFKIGQIRYAEPGEKSSKLARDSAQRHRRGARSSISMRGDG
jgi:hypothetical protein